MSRLLSCRLSQGNDVILVTCISFYAEESLVLEFHSPPSERKTAANRPVYAKRIARLIKRAKPSSILFEIF